MAKSESPFGNIGLGMMGNDASYANAAMSGGKGSDKPTALGLLLADFIKNIGGKKNAETSELASIENAAAPPSLPSYDFQSVLGQQNFVAPYQNADGSPIVPNGGLPPPTTSLQGFMTQPYRVPEQTGSVQPNALAGFQKPTLYGAQFKQPTTQGISMVDQLWGK